MQRRGNQRGPSNPLPRPPQREADAEQHLALTLRRLIEFKQAGGELNIVLTGINVGGQPHWNTEATMLMHTRGILVMTRVALAAVTEQVRSRKLGEVTGEFDAIHTVERAHRLGSVDRIIAARDLRPYVVDVLERGMDRGA